MRRQIADFGAHFVQDIRLHPVSVFSKTSPVRRVTRMCPMGNRQQDQMLTDQYSKPITKNRRFQFQDEASGSIVSSIIHGWPMTRSTCQCNARFFFWSFLSVHILTLFFRFRLLACSKFRRYQNAKLKNSCLFSAEWSPVTHQHSSHF